MKYLTVLFIVASCGSRTEQEPGPCTVSQQGADSIITCPDGTSSVLHQPPAGVDGKTPPPAADGKEGATGQPGESIVGPRGLSGPAGGTPAPCQAQQQPDGVQIVCPDTTAFIANGVTGPAGEPAPQAQPCSVLDTQAGALVVCPDGSSVEVRDGSSGTPGHDSIMEIIDPCGPHSGPDEVLLHLSSGVFLAWYQDLGLSVLEPGSYQTTDSQHCHFVITGGGNYHE